MKNLLIMAGGNSSRMKKSIEKSTLSKKEKEFVRKVHKSLIPIGKEKKPLLYYLISNAVISRKKYLPAAGIDPTRPHVLKNWLLATLFFRRRRR